MPQIESHTAITTQPKESKETWINFLTHKCNTGLQAKMYRMKIAPQFDVIHKNMTHSYIYMYDVGISMMAEVTTEHGLIHWPLQEMQL